MKPDLYTKAILTTIAVCLMWLVAKDVELVGTARAGYGNVMDVNVVQIDGKRFSSLDVSSLGATLPVKVK